VTPALKNPSELLGRLGLAGAERLLLVDVPPELAALVAAARPADAPEPFEASARAIRSVKDAFDAIVFWREDRVGAQALLEALAKRLAPTGSLWVVTAMRKVSGPRTKAVHRLDRRDLEKVLGARGLSFQAETRVSAWNVAYRFGKA
jgi:hypothetical protein